MSLEQKQPIIKQVGNCIFTITQVGEFTQKHSEHFQRSLARIVLQFPHLFADVDNLPASQTQTVTTSEELKKAS